MKYLLLLVMLGMVGCGKGKPKEYIYVKATESFFGMEKETKWYKAEVLEKDGDMWYIKAGGNKVWVNIKDFNKKEGKQ